MTYISGSRGALSQVVQIKKNGRKHLSVVKSINKVGGVM